MATVRKEQIRAKVGAELDNIEAVIDNCFVQLNQKITLLGNIKTKMQSYPALFDASDLEEVDMLITKITSQYTSAP